MHRPGDEPGASAYRAFVLNIRLCVHILCYLKNRLHLEAARL